MGALKIGTAVSSEHRGVLTENAAGRKLFPPPANVRGFATSYYIGEKMINENQENKYPANDPLRILFGVLIGGLVGAVTMLLLAPQSGKDTRMQIQKKASNCATGRPKWWMTPSRKCVQA